jgi:catechol 2,3-dioxygenase-like lactoylglutathione lyase family enzyme
MALAHITLATRNVAGSVAFFTDVLCWQPVKRPGNISVASAWLAIGAGIELHLIEDPDFEPSRFEREFGRHVAVTFPRTELPRLRERLLSHGAELIEPVRETPFARFFFRDPNGYVFEIIEEEHDEPRTIA